VRNKTAWKEAPPVAAGLDSRVERVTGADSAHARGCLPLAEGEGVRRSKDVELAFLVAFVVLIILAVMLF
jgi:hypothetical protein